MPATALKYLNFSSGVGTYGATGDVKKRLMGLTDLSLKVAEKVGNPALSGYLGPGPIAVEVAQSAEGNFNFVPTYEMMPDILNGFFSAIGASTSAGAPYTYPYTGPVGSTQAHATYTMEQGTTGMVYRTNGTVFTELSLKGEQGGLWEGTVNYLAKNALPVSTGMSTAVGTTGVHVARMADTTLYIDAFSSGTIGGTAVSGTFISFDASIKTGRHLKTYAGSVFPTDYGEGKWDGTLKLVTEFNTTSKALVDELLGTTGAAVKRQIRIKATEGSGSSERVISLDFAGIKNEAETLWTDKDGNMTVELNFAGSYSTGLANWIGFSVQNGSSSTT